MLEEPRSWNQSLPGALRTMGVVLVVVVMVVGSIVEVERVPTAGFRKRHG
jgi:hypothetical protein